MTKKGSGLEKDKETWQLNAISDPGLDSTLEGKILWGHYCVNWQKWDIDGSLDKSIVPMLSLLKIITVI